MRSICTALVLLMVYLVLVFLVFRVFDLVLLWQHGISSTNIVDPLLLSARQLKQLLEIRGVSYRGYVEKKELVELVEASAEVVQGEIDELNEMGGGFDGDREKLSSTPNPSYFTGAAHFYEEVEDTKDSVWLVQVVPAEGQRKEPLLDDYTWRVVRSQVAPFAIRTGIFDCRLDRRMCKIKEWDEPLLLLSLPRGIKSKDKVIMRTCKLTHPHSIIDWLREELSIRVAKIPSYEDMEKNWLQNNSTGTNEVNKRIKVLLLTHLLHPPLFLAALSTKFSGRISFGIFSVKKEDLNKTGKVPTYLVITPEKTVVYGKRSQEHFNLRSMNAFLRVIQPEVNDIFLCSLLLMNMFSILQALQVPLESWWRVLVVSVWTMVVCNLLLFSLWLILLGTLRWPSLCNATGDWWLGILRQAALSPIGSLVRSDWLRLVRSPWVLLGSLISFGLVGAKLLKSYQRASPGGNQRRWWEIDCLFSQPASPLSQPVHLQEVELEEGIEMLIERIAVPNFWLQAVIPNDYIKDLFVWKYRGQRTLKRDSPEVLQKIMDSKDDSILSKVSGEINPKFADPEPEEFLIKTTECAICLDKYRSGALLCALPCGHNYHQKCIFVWLHRDNHHCPVCRWPAYKNKNTKCTQ